MARCSEKDVRYLEGIVNNLFKIHGHNERILVQWGYGKPKCLIGKDGNFGKDLSPRLSVGEMYGWLDSFIKGLDIGLNMREDDSLAIEAIKESISVGYDIDIHAEGYAARLKYYVRLFFDGGVVAEESDRDLNVVLRKIGTLARQLSRRGC